MADQRKAHPWPPWLTGLGRASPPAQAQKEAILGRYQSLSQLNPEAAAAIKAVYESAAIQGLIADKEQKLDLDDNAF